MIVPETFRRETARGELSNPHLAALLASIETKREETLSRLRMLELTEGRFVSNGKKTAGKRLKELKEWETLLLKDEEPIAITKRKMKEGVRKYPGQPDSMHWKWYEQFVGTGAWTLETIEHELECLVYRIDSRTFCIPGNNDTLPEIPWLEEESREEALSTIWLKKTVNLIREGKLKKSPV